MNYTLLPFFSYQSLGKLRSELHLLLNPAYRYQRHGHGRIIEISAQRLITMLCTRISHHVIHVPLSHVNVVLELPECHARDAKYNDDV